MSRAHEPAAGRGASRLVVSVGGVGLDLRFPKELEKARETLARLLKYFAVEKTPEEPALVEVAAAPRSKSPEPLSGPLREALAAPSARFPEETGVSDELGFAAPFSRKLNRLAGEHGPDLAAYPFPDGCVLGCARTGRFTVVVDELARLGALPWTILHALYFLTSLLCATRRGLMLHACALMMDGAAALFVGRSGSGKTTVVELAGRGGALADDCVLLFAREGGFVICDTPFNQVSAPKDGPRAEGVRAGLGLFLKKDSMVHLEPMSPGGASAHILANHIHFLKYFPPAEAAAAFRLTAKLARSIPFFHLHFTKDNGFLDAVRGKMGGLNSPGDSSR